MTLKIYTRTGDEGDTGLFGGGRVGKDHPRVVAYGDIDELNACIGQARSVEMMPRIDEVLAPIQRDLFAIGALLATPDLVKMKEQRGAHRRPRPSTWRAPSAAAPSARSSGSSATSRCRRR